MLRWLKTLFKWKDARNTGIWLYQENRVTGERRAIRVGRGWQPVDVDWLNRRKDYK